MLKKILLTSIALITVLKIIGQETSSENQSKKEKKAALIKSFTYGGYEFIKPNALRHGYSITNGYWAGPTLDVIGILNVSYQQGYFTKIDSGKTYNSSGSRFSISMNVPFPILKYKVFNIVPHLGIGGYSHKGNDPYIESKTDMNGGFGFNANVGLSCIVGPVKVGAKCYFEGGLNSSNSIFKGAKAVPAISIAFSPQTVLLNPKIFSYRGMKHWKENFNTTSTYSDKANYDGSVTRTTTYTTTWNEMSGVGDAKIVDVNPFFFIGPRVQTNLLNLSKESFFPAYGFNAGVRCGTFFINGIYDKGDFYFKEPDSKKIKIGDTKKEDLTRNRYDGYLKNSSRIGGEIGFDLITYFIKANFDDQNQFLTKTSYYSIILKAGYFQQNNGNARFLSDSGSVALDSYFASTGFPGQPSNDVRLIPSKLNCFTFGGTVSIGSIAFNYDHFWFSGSKPLSHNEFSISYHYPIIRMFKAASVFSKTMKKKKHENKKE